MKNISDILTDVMADPTITDDAREAIWDGLERPHRHCPCAACMRAYLRSVETARVGPAELAEGARR
jgi:hypothetical protein